MNRAVFSALLAVVLAPAAAHAQSLMPDLDRPLWGPRIRVTPFIGQAPAVSRLERWTVTGPGGVTTTDYDVELGSGPTAGLSVEVLAVERFAFIGSFALVSRSRTREYSTADAEFYNHEGSAFLLAKGALAVRLREQVSELQVRTLTATAFVGPAFIREMPKDDAFANPVLLDPLTHWGINFGVNAEIPLGWNSLAIQAGAEDYYTWWNKTEFGRRNDAIFAANGFETQSLVEADPSHMWIFRAGLSFRVQ
jgi:hypothetical protein